MSRTTFREFLTALDEANSYCDNIKDPVIRKACKNLNKKSYKVRMYGSIGPRNGSGSGPGPGTGGGAGPGTGTGGGAFGGPGGAGGSFGSGGSGGGAGAGGGAGGGGGGM